MKFSPTKIIGLIVPLLVLLAVGYGLFLVGSPSAVRASQNDQHRLGNLQLISGNVESYYVQNGQLPTSLEAVVQKNKVVLPTDPVTKTEYSYRTTGALAYELCATFETPPTATDLNPNGGDSLIWKRTGIGKQCFALTITPPSLEVCDAFHSCSQGESCVVLPGHTSAACVVIGQECAAAGCANNCLISTSYPSHVSCQPLPVK